MDFGSLPILAIAFLSLVGYLAAFVLLAAPLKQGDHRVCRACGYDIRTARPGEKCPECGGRLHEGSIEWASQRHARSPIQRAAIVLAFASSVVLGVSGMFILLGRLM